MKKARLTAFACIAALVFSLAGVLAPSAFAAGTDKYSRDGTFALTKMVKNSGYSLDHSKKYAYRHLKTGEKGLYDSLKRCILDLGVSVSRPLGLNDNDLARVVSVMKLNEPELFWFSDVAADGNSVYPIYGISSMKKIQTMQKNINTAAKRVTAKVKAKKTVYERAKYIHDYIIVNNEYDGGSMFAHAQNYTGADIYDALVTHNPLITDGYTKSFQYLCDLCGLESFSVHAFMPFYEKWSWGVDSGISTNMVKAGGKWYNVCTCLDEDVAGDFEDILDTYVSYAYFMVPDSSCDFESKGYDTGYYQDGSKISIFEVTVPVCSSDSMSWYKKNKAQCANEAQLKKSLRSQMSRLAASGRESGVIQARADLYSVADLDGLIAGIFDDGKITSAHEYAYKYVTNYNLGIVIIVVYDKD